MVLSKALLSILICPVSKGELVMSECGYELISLQAKLAYPIIDDVPILLAEKARSLSASEMKQCQKMLLANSVQSTAS